jgi:hypothetical protein
VSSAGVAQQDEDAAELNKAEVIEGLALVAHDEAAEIAQPSEEPLDLPTTFVATERSAVLRLGFLPIASMRRNYLDA